MPNKTEDRTTHGPVPCQVVGIGASAGGLNSIEKMFRALPPDPNAAFVIIQHLSPDFKSLMGELMARFTEMPIEPIEDGTLVRPGRIYLLPAGKELEIAHGRLRVSDRDARGGLTLPIDRFLTSLAVDLGDRALAVILSGSGTDGSRGALRVRDAGGFVLVEDPETAQFDGMPSAAISSGAADRVLPASEIGPAVVERIGDLTMLEARADHPLITAVTKLLHTPLGIDFSQYKLPTVTRRIERRVAMHGLERVEDYLDLLKTNSDELFALGQDLLIGVTRFFRDPATWELLESTVIPRLVEQADPVRGVRAWVAGCATGEEAYSLAMLLLEGTPKDLPVKVFATDVHRCALGFADKGTYPLDRLEHVETRLRHKYFSRGDDGRLVVSATLRRSVVFAAHNLLKDAPFTQLDLVSCRNLLIYLRPKAQRQALSMLHYGLRLGGALLLGNSESLGEIESDYLPISESHRLYTRTQSSGTVPELSLTRRIARVPRPQRTAAEDMLLPLYDAVLDLVMSPAFLVGQDRRLLDCLGGSERYLRHRRRRTTTDITELVPEAARLPLAGALARAARESRTVRFDGIEWELQNEAVRIDATVDSLQTSERGQAFLITLHHGSKVEPQPPVETLSPDELSLERELGRVKQSLQSTLAELEMSGEEMQATNEELTASNEELQSVNEELKSVNAELQSKIQELTDVNRDMRHLFESIDIAIVFLDEQLRIRRYTPAAASLFGLLEHDVGRLFGAFNHPLQYSDLMKDIERCYREGKRYEYEVRDVHGRMHLVQVRADEDSSRRLGVVLSVTDLTALAEVRRRVETLSAVVDSSGDAILALDLEGRFTLWNRAAEELYGYSSEEMKSKSFDAFVPEDRRAELQQALSEVRAGKAQVGLETVRLHRDGTPLQIESFLSPIRDTADNLIGISKIDRNVGERRRREAELLERERWLDDSYHNSPDMLASLDLKTGRVLNCNQTMQRNLGYSQEELTAMHFIELYDPSSQQIARRIAQTVKAEGSVHDVELKLRRKDGSVFDVALSATGLRDDEGNVVRTRSVLRDITERKQAEQTMAAAIRARERFLGTVSHELRTPMHAIRSAVMLLQSEDTDAATAERAHAVLERQSAQMKRLLDDLIDIASIAEGRMEFTRQPVDLRAPIRDAIDAWTLLYEERDISLKAMGLDVEVPLRADPARLQQAISNLLGNALRHSNPGEQVHLRLRAEEQRALITVSDTGAGIDPEQLESIFEPFSFNDDRRIHRGSLGLGLNIAQRIISAHGGTIRAHSDGVDRGAEFTIELPLTTDVRPQQDRPLEETPLRVVVIEDQPDALEMLTLFLERAGHQVLSAECGRDGVEVIVRERPDVALVDIGLPDIDGYQVAAEVRRQIGDAVPLLAVTGYGSREDITKSREVGFRAHLTKPISVAKLLRVMQEAIGTEGQRAELPL